MDSLAALRDLPLGPIRAFETIGSTNTEAATWADAGAPELALVTADEQTAGRGRRGRRWFTPPGAALAFSLVLRPEGLPAEARALDVPTLLGRLTALGAVAVCEVLRQEYHLAAEIKWPNDVLIERKKACGILAEAQWGGSELAAVILGIGLNVSAAAIPPADEVIYPATAVEVSLGRTPERGLLLRQILERLLYWRAHLADLTFWQAWQGNLAFKGEWVHLVHGLAPQDGEPIERGEGRLMGLTEDGCLRLRDCMGDDFILRTGELHLRPPDWLESEV